MKRMDGKVAIVAGAAWGGIGAATALLLAQEGARVVVNTRSRPEKLEETAARIREAGGEVTTVIGDVAEAAAWEEMVAAAHQLFGLYSAAKGGLNALMRSVALDYGPYGIRANAVAPGQIVGEREAARLEGDPREEAASRDCYPLGRYGYPEDIARCALFLASDEAAFVTGITLTADGGLTLQSPEALVRPSFRARWREDVLVPQPRDRDGE